MRLFYFHGTKRTVLPDLVMMPLITISLRRFRKALYTAFVCTLMAAIEPVSDAQNTPSTSIPGEDSAPVFAPPKPPASRSVKLGNPDRPKQAGQNSAIKDRKTIVALDIGHSTGSPGSTSAFGRTEYSYNKEVASRIASKLSQSEQIQPFVVNPDGHTISLRLRTELARRAGADLFLSVHHDAAQPKYMKEWVVDGQRHLYSDDFRGYGVFVSQKNPFPDASRHLGTLLGQEMRRAGFQFSPHHNEPIPGENRPILDRDSGLYRYDDLIVLKTARMPAALLECGVIIHREEARILAQSETQERIATAVASALEKVVAESARSDVRR